MRTLLLLSFATAVHAQAAPDSSAAPPADARVEAAFADLGYTYDVTDDGTYALSFEVDGGRTQAIYVRPATRDFDGLEVREVYSVAGRAAPDGEPFPPDLALRLLRENVQFALGAWGVSDGHVLFRTAVDADASPGALADALSLILTTADALEAELSPGRDQW